MGTGSFPGVKRPRCGVDRPPHLAPRLKKEYSYTFTFALGIRGLFKANFTFTFTLELLKIKQRNEDALDEIEKKGLRRLDLVI